jgi:hypothetical protein
MLFVPAVGAAGATAFAWWREWPHVHWAWAPLAIALALAVSEKLWMRGQVVRRGGWWYVLGLSLAPFLLLEPYREEPWPGAAAFALAAIAWAVAAWRSEGTVGQLFSLNTALTPRAERRAIALGSYGLGLIALGHFNQALGLSRPEAGWTYAAVGAAAILLTCVPHERVRDWLDTVTFAGFVGFGIGVASAGTHAGELSAMFALAAVTFTASGLVNRSDNRLIVAALSAVVSGALLWSWREWPLWSLSLVYGGAAAVLFVTFAPARKARTPFPAASSFLSVAPILLAVATSGISVLLRDLDQQFNGFGGSTEGDSITRTPEWFATVVNVAIGGSMLVFEAFYRRSRQAAVAGSAVLLVALEMAIASLEIDNIQVYTAPLAIYVIGLGLSVRQSQPFFGHHMLLHETLFVVGAAILVLPAAEQSFEPGGANWGLLVIVQGMALLAVGLTLFQRWLAVAGVVTLVAVAARFVFDNTANGNIPYWVMLGVAGLALLGVGVLMLLERDWWDRTKARMARWWLEGERPEPPGPGAPSAPAPQP